MCNARTSYAGGDTCTVNVTFTPTKAGTRYGAVNLLNSSGAVIATASVYGAGRRAADCFQPASADMIGSTFERTLRLWCSSGQQRQRLHRRLSPVFRTSQVLKPTLQSDGSYVQSKIGIRLNEPHGVDDEQQRQRLYHNELGDSVLKETPQPDGSYRESIIAFTIGPVGMAVDGSGKCQGD